MVCGGFCFKHTASSCGYKATIIRQTMFRPVLLFNGVKQKHFYEVKAAANKILNKITKQEACLQERWYKENAITTMLNNEDVNQVLQEQIQ